MWKFISMYNSFGVSKYSFSTSSECLLWIILISLNSLAGRTIYLPISIIVDNHQARSDRVCIVYLPRCIQQWARSVAARSWLVIGRPPVLRMLFNDCCRSIEPRIPSLRWAKSKSLVWYDHVWHANHCNQEARSTIWCASTVTDKCNIFCLQNCPETLISVGYDAVLGRCP